MSKATNAGRGKIQWRDIDGILLLDKPVGLSSNQALQQVRRLFRARKAGHTGSLDPLASGMLPICLGQATKLCGQLLASDKRYRTVIRLGQKTNTGDAEGTVVEQSNPVDLRRARIEQTLQGFVGAIQQVPPMYSALKHEGQRLYDLARKGVEVQRQARTVQIHAIELLGWQSPDLEVEVHCSKGTYIRVLGEDIAASLDQCGHLAALRRTQVAPFDAGPMHRIDTLKALSDQSETALGAMLLPSLSAVAGWPRVDVDADQTRRLSRGQAVEVHPDGAFKPAAQVAIVGADQCLLGLGRIEPDGRLQPKRWMQR